MEYGEQHTRSKPIKKAPTRDADLSCWGCAFKLLPKSHLRHLANEYGRAANCCKAEPKI